MDISLDESQRRALELALTSSATVIAGASGTGKTTVLQEAATRLMAAGESLVVLAAGRRAADMLRTRLTVEFGQLPQNVAVRTVQAWAFTILQAYAADRERQTPELITGPTQDAIISELLMELGDTVGWPDEITSEVVELPGFRAELRDLMTRAAELGLHGPELQLLGEEMQEGMWVAAGRLLGLYESSLALEDATAPGGGGADRFDHARLVHQAARLLRTPESWNGEMPRWDWILVDDYQNATLAAAGLLTAVHDSGTNLILTADPDTAVEGFRGGIAHLPGLARGDRPGLGLRAQVATLSERHRGGENLAKAQDILTSRIGVAGLGSHRRPEPGEVADSLVVRSFPSSDQQLSGIARIIRHEHVRRGLPYDDVAIITRSRSAHTDVERVLVEAGVHVRPAARDRPLRFYPVVRALMDVLREAHGYELDDGVLLSVLASPLVGLEPVQMRDVRRRMTQWSVDHEADHPVRALLSDCPAQAWAAPLRALSRILSKTAEAVARGDNAEAVLWTAWQAAGRAEEWRDLALAGGPAGRAANAMLDAVMRMFRVAQRMVDRDGRTSSMELVHELDAQEIAEDSIARMGMEHGVHLLTPAMAVGQEFELVIIADTNDDVWPNLRMRDGLFGAGKLAELYLDRLTDGVSGIRSVLDDELRMFVSALGRATRAVVVTAVDSEETSHSRFIDLMVPEQQIERVESSELSMSVPGVVGRLRSVLSDPELGVNEEDQAAAATLLASLPTWTGQRIAGVDPDTWVPILPPSTDASWSSNLRLSPSAVENVLQCPLKWFVDSRGFSDTDDTRHLDVGNLIHGLAEDFPQGRRDELMAAFEERWPALAETMEDGLERVMARQKALAMVETLATYLSASPPADVEQKVLVETDAFTVSGRIDRIEHGAEGPIIVDFKTGSSIASKADAEANPQLKVYQWAYERSSGLPTAGARLVYTGKALAKGGPTIREQGPLTDADREAVASLLRQVKDDLSGHDLEARANKNCQKCRVKTVCPLYEEGALFS